MFWPLFWSLIEGWPRWLDCNRNEAMPLGAKVDSDLRLLSHQLEQNARCLPFDFLRCLFYSTFSPQYCYRNSIQTYPCGYHQLAILPHGAYWYQYRSDPYYPWRVFTSISTPFLLQISWQKSRQCCCKSWHTLFSSTCSSLIWMGWHSLHATNSVMTMTESLTALQFPFLQTSLSELQSLCLDFWEGELWIEPAWLCCPG